MHVLDLVRAHPAEAAVAALAAGPLLARLLPHLSSWVEIVARWLLGMIVVRRTLITEDTCEVILFYLYENAWSTELDRNSWFIAGRRVNSLDLWREVVFRVVGWSHQLFLYRGAPLVFSYKKAVGDQPVFSIYHLRGTVR